MRRLLLDATTLASGIAGLAYRGPSARLVEELLVGTFEACCARRSSTSSAARWASPTSRKRISAGQVSAALEDLTAISVLCTDPTDPPRVLRDPNDDYLLALAASAGAQAIVTGDKDLLEHPGLHPPAITARQAVEQLGLS